MRSLIISAALLAALLVTGCATVTTQVVEFKPTQRYAPTADVEILLEKPARAHEEIALIESRGEIGTSEAALLELEIERHYHPPVMVYEPWHDPFWAYHHRYRFHPYHALRPFPPFMHPWGPYRVVGGGYTYTLKALAIRYRDTVG
jgi:hypothetical protein